LYSRSLGLYHCGGRLVEEHDSQLEVSEHLSVSKNIHHFYI